VPISALLRRLKVLWDKYAELMGESEFLLEMANKLFNQNDYQWVSMFLINSQNDLIWNAVQVAFTQVFQNRDSGTAAAAKYGAMVKKPLSEESIHDWVAINDRLVGRLKAINPKLAPSTPYPAMLSQLQLGSKLDSSGSLNRIRDVFLEEFNTGDMN